jgi:hypothetical protein
MILWQRLFELLKTVFCCPSKLFHEHLKKMTAKIPENYINVESDKKNFWLCIKASSFRSEALAMYTF